MNRIATLLCCCMVTLPCGAGDLATNVVRYERLVELPEHAFSTAVQFERRLGASPELGLAKASLAFDLGLEPLAERELAAIDEHLLDPVDRDELNLYLARIAYNADDVAELDRAIEALGDPGETGWATFLIAERARIKGDTGAAAAALAGADRRSIMAAYARYNLATDLYRTGEINQAAALFEDVRTLRAKTSETRALLERAGIALATIALDAGDDKRAWRVLSALGSESEAGIRGMVLLARRATEAGDWDRAAALWQHLLETHPWHRAIVPYYIALPWVIERAAGPAAALAVYEETRESLHARADALGQLPPLETGLVVAAIMGDAAALDAVATRLGDSQWLDGLTDEDARRAATRWLRMHRASAGLASRQDDLAALREVGAEQSRRLELARQTLDSRPPADLLARHATRARGLIAQLEEIRDEGFWGAGLEAFAEGSERQQLDRIAAIEARLGEGESAGGLRERLLRLRHLVWFTIHDDLPHRAQQRIAIAEQLLARIDGLGERVERVASAARHIETEQGLPARISRLAARNEFLSAQVDIAMGSAETQLMAGVQQAVDEHLAALDDQMLVVDIAIARIEDGLMLASEDAP